MGSCAMSVFLTKHSDSELKLLLLLLHVGLVATTCTGGMKGEGGKNTVLVPK